MYKFMAIDPNFDFKSFFFLFEPKKLEIKKEGSKAILPIMGVLGNDYFSDTKYNEIIASLNNLKNDEFIEEIELKIDSPGGEFKGITSVLKKIREVRSIKKVVSKIVGSATSAAHAIAAQGSEIVSTNATNYVGSIGVLSTQRLRDDIVHITSKQASKKAYDVRTDEGKEDLEQLLSELHTFFVAEIVKGYNNNINSEILNDLKGRVITSDTALKLNLINRIENSSDIIENNSELSENTKYNNNDSGSEKMDLNELKTKFPNLVNALFEEFKESNKKVNSKVTNYLLSDAYPKPIKNLCAKVLNGEENESSLNATIAAFDAIIEQGKEEKSIKETEKIGETKAEFHGNDETSDIISSSKDFLSAKEKIKKYL